MRSEFSEFTYGYSLIEHIARRYGWFSVAPHLPSLLEEKGVGYDARLDFPGFPFFVQFKLSEYVASRSASQWHLFNSAFFRFAIRSKGPSFQHQTLVDLEAGGELVLYAAPGFHRRRELNERYQKGTVVNGSMFVRPSSVGAITDNLSHFVVFASATSSRGYVCSEPKAIGLHPGTELSSLLNLEQRNRDYRHHTVSDIAVPLYQRLLGVIERRYGQINVPQPGTTFRQVAYLARTFLDLELFLYRPVRT